MKKKSQAYANRKFLQLQENAAKPVNIKVGMNEGRLIIDFGKALQWIALEPHAALELASLITTHVTLAKAPPPEVPQ